MASQTITELPLLVADAAAENYFRTQSTVELDGPSCKCGSQNDRPTNDVIWCIADIARHYRRSQRWAYRIINQQGFPKPTRADQHRWYKQSILKWDREAQDESLSDDLEKSDRLVPDKSALSRDGRTSRPSQRKVLVK